jgi:WD40 repeat protein
MKRVDTEFMLWRTSLDAALWNWETAPKELKTALLLAGPALTEAEKWFQERRHDLPQAQQSFIQRSIISRHQIRQRERETAANAWRAKVKRRGRFVMTVLAIFVCEIAIFQAWKTYVQFLGEDMTAAAPAGPAHEGSGAGTTLPAPGSSLESLPIEAATDVAAGDGRPAYPGGGPEPDVTALVWQRLAAGDPETGLLVALEGLGDGEPAKAEDFAAPPSPRLVGMALAGLRAMAGRPAERPPIKDAGELSRALLAPGLDRVLSPGDDDAARLLDAASGHVLATLEGHARKAQSAAFSLDGRQLAIASDDGRVRLIDARSGAETAILRGHAASVAGLAFSPDGAVLASASEDNTARVWPGAGAQQALVLSGHTEPLRRIVFSVSGRFVATASDDGTVRIWEALSGTNRATIKGYSGNVMQIAFGRRDERLLTLSTDGAARLWGSDTGKLVAVIGADGAPLLSAAFSPDGGRIATVSSAGEVRVFDGDKGGPLLVLAAPVKNVRSVAFAPTSRLLAIVDWAGSTSLWSAEDGTELASLPLDEPGAREASFSADGRILSIVGRNGSRQHWPVHGSVRELVAHARATVPRCLSEDERRETGLSPLPPQWCKDLGKPVVAGVTPAGAKAAAGSAQ